MFPRPELQSYTKFLLSVGVFLCLAAIVMPALVLRETTVLQVDRVELARLTPVARAELERRQRVARDLGQGVPWAAGVLLVGGLALIAYSLPGMRRKERADDDFAAASFKKLLRDIEPQTEQDREEAIREEDVEAAAAARVAAPVGARPRVPLGPPPELKDRDAIRHAREEVEARVVDRIASVTPAPQYEFRPNVKIPGPAADLRLDGLLVSRSSRAPDVVVEIKVVRFPDSIARMAVDQLISRLARYRARTGRPVAGWLILVVDESVDPRTLMRVETYADELPGELAVTAIVEATIDALTFPPLFLAL